MSAALIGNPVWLKTVCGQGVRRDGWRLEMLSGREANACEIVGGADMVILVTDQLDHVARRRVLRAAAGSNVPVLMRHSCGAHLFGACFKLSASR